MSFMLTWWYIEWCGDGTTLQALWRVTYLVSHGSHWRSVRQGPCRDLLKERGLCQQCEWWEEGEQPSAPSASRWVKKH